MRHFPETALSKGAKNTVFVTIVSLVNASKTRAKTILKLMHLACVLKHFVETRFKTKRAKNDAFMSNLHFGKCVQKTCWKRRFYEQFPFGKCVEITGKNSLEMRFETLCGDKFEKKTCEKRRFSK